MPIEVEEARARLGDMLQGIYSRDDLRTISMAYDAMGRQADEIARLRGNWEDESANDKAVIDEQSSELAAVREQLRWRDVREEPPDWKPNDLIIVAGDDSTTVMNVREFTAEMDIDQDWFHSWLPLPAIEMKP